VPPTLLPFGQYLLTHFPRDPWPCHGWPGFMTPFDGAHA
jgi:hypothetical protein